MNNKRPKKGYGYIYKYTSPSGKSYIGQTTRSLAERAGHNGKNYKGSKLLYEAFQKHGYDNFDIEILIEVKKEQLDDYEKKYIVIFNTLSPNGYNLTEGGQGFSSREKKKVYQYSMTDGSFIKEWNNADEAVQSINNNYNGASLSGSLTGRAFSAYGFCWSYLKLKKFPINERIVSPYEKKVKMYSLDKKLIKTFSSISQAAKETGSDRSAIKRCCRKELKSHNGYIWECSEIIFEKKYHNSAKSIIQIDPKTNEIIQVFSSISQAARAFGKKTSSFRSVLDNESKTAYGYRWKTAQGSTTNDT